MPITKDIKMSTLTGDIWISAPILVAQSAQKIIENFNELLNKTVLGIEPDTLVVDTIEVGAIGIAVGRLITIYNNHYDLTATFRPYPLPDISKFSYYAKAIQVEFSRMIRLRITELMNKRGPDGVAKLETARAQLLERIEKETAIGIAMMKDSRATSFVLSNITTDMLPRSILMKYDTAGLQVCDCTQILMPCVEVGPFVVL
jgi:hypothetical protein